MILRRLYIYLVSIASLAVLAFGLSALGQTIVLFIFNSPDASFSRTSLAGFTATVVVSFPVWAIHVWFGQRYARRDPSERASALRRLYLYLACAGSSIGAAIALSSTVADALQQQLDGVNYDRIVGAQSAWVAIVLLAIWAFHYFIAVRDHAAVGERGGSATLRRWYMYIALFVGLFMMLAGAQAAIQLVWLRAMHSNLYQYSLAPLSSYVGSLIGGAALWGSHTLILRRYVEDDRKSTLRAVEGFIAVAICIALALVSASQIMYYGVARVLGVDNPGGITGGLLANLAQPASTMLVYATAWILIRLRLARDAGSGEAVRQAGMRRLYTNLVALVSMAALAVGAAGLLGTLLVQAEAQIIGVQAPDWRDPVSLWVTLLVVGTTLWLAHWRNVPWLEDRQALSRRLYLWAALLGSVLAVLGGGISLLYAVFQQAFSTQPRLQDTANLAFAQSLAVVVVAAAVGIYHWRVMQSDAATRPARAPAPSVPVAAPVAGVPSAPAGHSPALEAAPGRHFELSVVGATEDDVHQALANLPPQASYKLTPSDRTA